MLFYAKLTAAFAVLYSLVATIGVAPVMVDQGENMGCDGPMNFRPRMILPAGFNTAFTVPLAIVLGIAALTVLIRLTPDLWSYRRVGLTTWLAMSAMVPCLIFAFDFADPTLRLYLYILNSVCVAISLVVMTAMLKRRRLFDAVRARVAARMAQSAPGTAADLTV